jgi:hypothetical protein
VAPELPYAGRREPEPWGHAASPELPQAERREPGPWDTRARAPALSFILTWSLYVGGTRSSGYRQQLRGDANAWWANYVTTRPVNYQVPWAEFRNAFRAHHILTGVMRKKHQEFMDLKQGRRFVHD